MNAAFASEASGAAAKLPSTIRLTTFAAYTRTKAGIRPLFGASEARLADDGKVELLAASAPFRSGALKLRAPKPGCGLLMLYGVRDTVDELFYWRQEARRLGAEFATAEVDVEVGYIEPGLTTPEMLRGNTGETRFINLRRMTSAQQTLVLERFAGYVAREPGAGTVKPMGRMAQIATRPDLFHRAFEDDRALGMLDVLVIPVADGLAGEGAMRQMAYVRPGARVVTTSQGSTEARILLPRWMDSRSAGSKWRRKCEAQGAKEE